MNGLFIYIVKAFVCSGILFGYYWTALRDKKFHQYNRFYILFSVVFSLLIPLVHLSWFALKEESIQHITIVRALYEGDLDPIVVTTHQLSWDTLIAYIIVGISIVLLLLLAIRVLSVLRLATKYPLIKWHGVELLNTDISDAPFSFLNYLFWKESIDVESAVGQQILEHELTHIRQKHTWDKLFMQIVSAVFWFNPFYWLMQRELQMIHEYLADEKAVKNNDVQGFAVMLLEAHFGKKILDPVHPFAYRPIQRRLKMLTSSNPKYSYMRRLFFLPLLLVVTGLFAFSVKKNNWHMDAVTLPIWIQNMGAKFHFSDSIQAGKSVLPDSVIIIRDNKKRDTISNVKPHQLAMIERVTSPTEQISDSDIEKSLHASSKHLESMNVNNKKPIYILDGKRVNDLEGISPESINVLKDQSATNIYGDEGKNGVILITSKKRGANMQSVNTPDTTKKRISLLGNINANVKHFYTEDEDSNPVVVVDYVKKQERIKEASFPGGKEAWKIFLMRNLNADVPTKNGAKANRNYTVVASFIVDKNGKLSQIKAENNPGYGTAEEVVRLLKKSPNWVPAIKNGKPVKYKQRQQVTFQVTEE